MKPNGSVSLTAFSMLLVHCPLWADIVKKGELFVAVAAAVIHFASAHLLFVKTPVEGKRCAEAPSNRVQIWRPAKRPLGSYCTPGVR
jgi:hypothetical protein